jgi:hypothetical protein
MGNGERTKNNKIQFPPLTRGGLGWGETIVGTLIIPFKTSSQRMFDKFSTGNFYLREQGTGNGDTQKTIKSSPLPLQGEG